MKEEFKTWSISDVANEEGLEIVTTTDDANGYPTSLKAGLMVDDDNPEVLTKIADRYGLTVVEVFRKNGWNLWARSGNVGMPEPFDMLSFNGNNVKMWQDTERDREGLLEDYKCEVAEAEDYDSVKEINARYDEIFEALDRVGEQQVVRTEFNSFAEITPRFTMAYEDDGTIHTYALVNY